MAKPNLVVVGHGMVGHKFLECLAAGGGHKRWNVIVFCEEEHPAYNRTALSEFFKGKNPEEFSLVKGNFFQQFEIQLLLGEAVTAIDPAKKLVTSSKGTKVPFDKLILATGSFPFIPPVTGSKGPGCFVYRTIDDLQAIQAYAKKCKKGTVIGGGLLGLEAAQALMNMQLETHVVEFAPRLMCVQLDEQAGGILLKHILSMGVKVHLKKNTTNVVRNGRKVKKVLFTDGDELETDMVVFSAGIRPRDQVARESGIKVGPRGGVMINDYCQTNFPDVYAIGEVALHRGRIYGLVSPGYQMARVCAGHILGRDVDRFLGAVMSTKLKVVGLEVGIMGDTVGHTPNSESFAISHSSKGIYKKVVTNSAMDKVLGGIFVGDIAEFSNVLNIMINGLPLPPDPESLIMSSGNRDVALGAGGVENLPSGAKICSCHGISKGELIDAIKSGAVELEDLKKCTKAGTGCGGCIPLLERMIEYERGQMGLETKNQICEHFPFSRQQLCHLIMVRRLREFQAVLEVHGRGLGCEVCKPAVASILAHTWGDHIHRLDLVVLQDTNDYFLGNMQRDGTYSIVPRTPGGEIHPKQLEMLGKIGQKYGLYTKITGAQRIDFFGAQVHQLPEIWKDLTAEGFESGHAYAKGLRTVKSCVGSTWCRYGVRDAVNMAILLENRYKGIRMPHKFKMAVSGCIRECAEAQGKDLGLIAVKNGYNLYVCGNGGMKPKHAQLLATDLDENTVIRVIDRFIMFYCRTADRLQRTARWLEAMDGGLDYLKAVILQDSLGICQELEMQLQQLVNRYQNEWATTIKNPVQLERFKTFINLPADQQDDESLQYEQERGQPRLPVQSPANPYPLSEPRPQPGMKFSGESTGWNNVCELEKIPHDSGVCAKVDGVQIAIFRTSKNKMYAIHNFDPFSEAFVLSRGLIGDRDGVVKVASPLYKHNFALETGECLTHPHVVLPIYPVRIMGGVVQVQSTPKNITQCAA